MPASWRTSDLSVLVVAAAGTVLLSAASFVISPPESLPRHDGSSYAAHPGGARAAFLLLQELGYSVERSFEPVAALAPRAPNQTVLVLASPSRDPSEQDVRALLRFLERGGLVLATGPNAAAFLPGALPVATARSSHSSTQRAAVPSPLSAGVTEVDMPVSGSPLPVESPYVPVFGNHEAAAVLTARFGEGRAVWWAGSDPLLNGGIARPGHVELFVNTIGPAGARTILWDEFYHGHTRSVWSYLAATPLPFAILQLGILGAGTLLSYARRRRPVRPPVVTPRTSPLEFIDTMGSLYERARAANAAIATVRARVRRRLLEAAGLPLTTSDDRLAAAAADRLSLGPEVASILSRSGAASTDPDLTSQQAVAIAAELQLLGSRAHAGPRSRQRDI